MGDINFVSEFNTTTIDYETLKEMYKGETKSVAQLIKEIDNNNKTKRTT